MPLVAASLTSALRPLVSPVAYDALTSVTRIVAEDVTWALMNVGPGLLYVASLPGAAIDACGRAPFLLGLLGALVGFWLCAVVAKPLADGSLTSAWVDLLDIKRDDDPALFKPAAIVRAFSATAWIRARWIHAVPSFLKSPDWEPAEWLNNMLAIFWATGVMQSAMQPLLDNAISAKVNEILSEKLEEAEVPVEYRKILKLVIERCDLGTVPPRVGGMRVLAGYMNWTPLELHLMWGSNLKARAVVTLELPKVDGKKPLLTIPVDVQNVAVSLILRVSLGWSPILPCVGSIQLSMPIMPRIDLELCPLDLPIEVANVLGVKQAIQAILSKVLHKKFVYPRRKVLTVESAMKAEMPPQGLLHVVLEGANGVRMPGSGGPRAWLDVPDPYVNLLVGDGEDAIPLLTLGGSAPLPGMGNPVRSTTKPDERNPEWNEDFYFIVRDLTHEALVVDFRDDNFGVGGDLRLGGGVFAVPIAKHKCLEAPGQWVRETARSWRGKRGWVRMPESDFIDPVLEAQTKALEEAAKHWNLVSGAGQGMVDAGTSVASKVKNVFRRKTTVGNTSEGGRSSRQGSVAESFGLGSPGGQGHVGFSETTRVASAGNASDAESAARELAGEDLGKSKPMEIRLRMRYLPLVVPEPAPTSGLPLDRYEEAKDRELLEEMTAKSKALHESSSIKEVECDAAGRPIERTGIMGTVAGLIGRSSSQSLHAPVHTGDQLGNEIKTFERMASRGPIKAAVHCKRTVKAGSSFREGTPSGVGSTTGAGVRGTLPQLAGQPAGPGVGDIPGTSVSTDLWLSGPGLPFPDTGLGELASPRPLSPVSAGPGAGDGAADRVGILFVEVISCRGLRSPDTDPCVDVTIVEPERGNLNARTRVEVRTPNPVYYQSFAFPNVSSTSTLALRVLDCKKTAGKIARAVTFRAAPEHEIGTLSLQVDDVARLGKIQQEYQLRNVSRGAVTLELRWQDLELDRAWRLPRALAESPGFLKGGPLGMRLTMGRSRSKSLRVKDDGETDSARGSRPNRNRMLTMAAVEERRALASGHRAIPE